jgi:hypothetical protein
MKTSRSPEATTSGSSTTTTGAAVGKSTIVQMHRAGAVQHKPAAEGRAQGAAAGGGAPVHAGSGGPGASTDANTSPNEPHGAKLQQVNHRLQAAADRKMQEHKDQPGATGGVQRKAAGSAEPGDIHAAAERGTAGASTGLPHGDRIQQAFGPDHDVSGIQAHVGGDAKAACDDMGASAFASGEHVAFAGSPDLHTAAHEAAHVVQQRAGVSLYGGVGEAGDTYEAHADAVADRVVAGESAADLLSSGPGASAGGAGVQRKAVQHKPDPGATAGNAVADGASAGAETAGGTTAPAGKTTGKKDRISIESKAWIPHAKVVDPEEPIRISDWLDTIDSLVNNAMNTIDVGGWFGVPLTPRLKYEYKSRYRGDNHSGYAGSARAHHKVEFDWDGTAISGLTSSGRSEATHRDYSYHAWIEWGPFSKDVVKSSGTETGPTAGGTTGTASGSSYDMNISAPNLLVITYAPPIDAHYSGTLSGSTLNVRWSTDNFPSHGYEVKKNGSAVQTSVVNNASWVPGEGPVGAAMIGAFLSLQTNNGSATVGI